MTPIIGPNNFFKEAYVINVKERIDRRVEFERMISQLNLGEIRRFEAIRDIQDGAWGCAQSHLAIIRMAKEKGLENVLIFEDDAMFVDGFADLIIPTLTQLMSFNWNFFYIGGRLIAPAWMVSPNLARMIATYCTHAYAVNHRMYDAILSYDHQKHKTIDIHYSFLTRDGNSYCMVPLGAHQRPSVSDLIGCHLDYRELLDWSYKEHIKYS